MSEVMDMENSEEFEVDEDGDSEYFINIYRSVASCVNNWKVCTYFVGRILLSLWFLRDIDQR